MCLRCDELFILKGWEGNSEAFEDFAVEFIQGLKIGQWNSKVLSLAMMCNNIFLFIYVSLISDVLTNMNNDIKQLLKSIKLFQPYLAPIVLDKREIKKEQI